MVWALAVGIRWAVLDSPQEDLWQADLRPEGSSGNRGASRSAGSELLARHFDRSRHPGCRPPSTPRLGLQAFAWQESSRPSLGLAVKSSPPATYAQPMKLSGQILTSRGWFQGEMTFSDKIEKIGSKLSVKERFIVPGFVDVHVHGGGGGDTMDGVDGIRTLARFHASHGTTSLLATTITNPWENVLHVLNAIKTSMSEPTGGARVVGAHLEGPFINPERLGAQPPNTVEPTPERVRQVLESGVVKVVTIAPEIPHALEAIETFLEAGVRVSLGHTAGTAEDANAVFDLATKLRKSLLVSGTHLYNAMGGLEGRKPGIVGALFGNPNAYSELILDGHHVHFSAFRAAFFAKPDKLMLVTDAMRAAGQPDGEYDLGGQTATLSHGQVRLPNGSLAGSVLTMLEAVRNAVKAGLALEVALKLASLHPAQYLGLHGFGKFENGNVADIVVLSDNLELEAVYIGGQRIV